MDLMILDTHSIRNKITESRYEFVGDSMEKLQDDYNLITGVYIGDVLDVHL